MIEDTRPLNATHGRGGVEREGSLPADYTESLHWLAQEDFGRALVQVHRTTISQNGVLERTHGESQGDFVTRKEHATTTSEFLGYILPLTYPNADRPEHLVCFTDGTMMHVKYNYYPLSPPEENKNNLEKYRKSLEPSRQPIPGVSMTSVKDEFLNGRGSFTNTTVLSVNNTSNEEAFAKIFDRAITVAEGRQTEKARTRKATVEVFTKKIAAMRRRRE